MRLVSAAIVAAVSASAARAAPSCPPGEAWDAPMAMCMPLPSPPVPNSPAAPLSNTVAYDLMSSPDGCGATNYYDFGMSMCLARPQRRGRVSAMLMGNAFFSFVSEAGPRGRTALAAPDWAMADVGVDVAARSRLTLDIMLTAERWLFPDAGYPLLLQIGENDAQGRPFIDAQHPHSSPIMGLGLVDAIALTPSALLRIGFAPRGESTDGPIAMMHRPTGTVNPDAPLGHHVGQDVGHITSTVIAAALFLPSTTLELSAFHGREPEPTRVDLPLGVPDSVAARVSQRVARHYLVSASLAYVTDPEGDATIPRELRVSASGYAQWNLGRWRAHATLIFGGITSYDHATFLASLGGEWLFLDGDNALWGRVEALQRTPAELAVASPAPNDGRWVGAVTAGYTRRVASAGPVDFSLGGSLSVSLVPDDFAGAYGGNAILSGKVFVEARVMQMLSTRR